MVDQKTQNFYRKNGEVTNFGFVTRNLPWFPAIAKIDMALLCRFSELSRMK
jgi:hypothetical protein